MVVPLLAGPVELQAEVGNGDETGAQHDATDEGRSVKLLAIIAPCGRGLGGSCRWSHCEKTEMGTTSGQLSMTQLSMTQTQLLMTETQLSMTDTQLSMTTAQLSMTHTGTVINDTGSYQ